MYQYHTNEIIGTVVISQASKYSGHFGNQTRPIIFDQKRTRSNDDVR